MAFDHRGSDGVHHDVGKWRGEGGGRSGPLIDFMGCVGGDVMGGVEYKGLLFDMRFKLRGSFQNTLINRITFWNRMGRQQALTVGTLVWAKVNPHPWWPGRVIVISFRSSKHSRNNASKSSRSPSSRTPPSTPFTTQHLSSPPSDPALLGYWSCH